METVCAYDYFNLFLSFSQDVPLPALGLLFQIDVHLTEMSAEVSLLLFRKDVEAPAFSGVLFTNPGAKLVGSP